MAHALDHLRVLELGEGVPVAYATKTFADLGADVIKVELPHGDAVRGWPPFLGDHRGPTASGLFAFLNTGKRSVALDYRTPGGADALRALAASADILLEGWAPGTLASLGLAPADLRALSTQLIITSVTPYGQTGPRAAWRGTDLTAAAVSGMAMTTPSRVGDPERIPPLRPGGRQADYIAGAAAATATLFAVHLRHRTGQGTTVDVSEQASMASFTRMDIAFRTFDPHDTFSMGTSAMDRSGPPMTIWGLMRCKDGYWAFQATEEYQWRGLMRSIGDPEWSYRPEYDDGYKRIALWGEINDRIEQYTRQYTKAEIYHAGQAEHVPVFPCYTTEEAFHDEQIRARNYFVTVERPDVGPVTLPGPAVRYSETPLRFGPWPAIGEHTDAVLAPLLGAAQVTALREQGALS